ncbi:hypothetical protein [Novosphingobium silvae]|jgi:hypothetical protein|uniref:hypothetical protein n=1 Tax=Novosphingobium silvae TaxID=2692619 RepID=UPI001F2903D7|nr:hypothetical protein [Novosphingobium silvae]
MKANSRRRATASRFPKDRAVVTTSLFAALAAIGVAACVPPPPATPAPAQAAGPSAPVRPAPPPPQAGDWRDAPLTPGDWSYAANSAGSTASFGGVFSLSCNLQSRTVTLTRAATMARAAPASMGVITSNASRTLATTVAANGLAAALPARDPLLDAMAFSKGRFVIAVSGEQTLYVPSWTEVTRVVEDCR